ncbi:unnamed protein product, partial [Rotaria magnacalcarata]
MDEETAKNSQNDFSVGINNFNRNTELDSSPNKSIGYSDIPEKSIDFARSTSKMTATTTMRLSTIHEDEDDKVGLAKLNNDFENYLNKVKSLANINIDLRQKIVNVLQGNVEEEKSNSLEIKFNNLRQELNDELQRLISINVRLQRADYDKKYYYHKIRAFSNSNQLQIMTQQLDSSLYELNLLKEQYTKQQENLQTCKYEYNDYMKKLIEYTDDYNKITYERVQTENSLCTLSEQLVFEQEYNHQCLQELKSLEKIQQDSNDHFNKTEFDNIISKIRQDYQQYNQIQLSELEVYYKIKLDLVQYNFHDSVKENNFEEIQQLQEQNKSLQQKLTQLNNNFQHVIERNRQQYELLNDDHYDLEVEISELESFILQSRNSTIALSSEINTYRCLLTNLAPSFQQPIKSSAHKEKPENLTIHYKHGLMYGWVPRLDELPTNITKRYRWIDGASITLMEFIHGAFRTHNPNALFLIRNSENILKSIPDKYKDRFQDKDEYNQNQIQELRNQLHRLVSPQQIVHYDCLYDGLDSSTGRERVKIDGLNDFEEQAKQFLIEAIKKWYPNNFNNTHPSDPEQQQMNTFLLNKTQIFVDRPKEFASLLKYVAGDHKDFSLIDGGSSNKENAQPLMALTGRSGDGKTMLLGKFVLTIE